MQKLTLKEKVLFEKIEQKSKIHQYSDKWSR